MSTPDPTTWLIFLLQSCVSVIIWFRNSGVKEWQHRKMWAQFEKDHGINGNGKPAKEL